MDPLSNEFKLCATSPRGFLGYSNRKKVASMEDTPFYHSFQYFRPLMDVLHSKDLAHDSTIITSRLGISIFIQDINIEVNMRSQTLKRFIAKRLLY